MATTTGVHRCRPIVQRAGRRPGSTHSPAGAPGQLACRAPSHGGIGGLTRSPRTVGSAEVCASVELPACASNLGLRRVLRLTIMRRGLRRTHASSPRQSLSSSPRGVVRSQRAEPTAAPPRRPVPGRAVALPSHGARRPGHITLGHTVGTVHSQGYSSRDAASSHSSSSVSFSATRSRSATSSSASLA